MRPVSLCEVRWHKTMLIHEFKIKAKPAQYAAIDEAIRTAQFVQNKCLRYWMDNKGVGKYDLNKHCAVLAKAFVFANELNSQARQASAERAWSAIARFYNHCKKGIQPTGYPQFKKNGRSVEYKTTGWKLLDPKHIQFTDQKNIGRVKLVGTWDLAFYPVELIKRVRLLKRADGYYAQFCIQVERNESTEATQKAIGLDVGLAQFYTDSAGHAEPNPRFYRVGEKRLKRSQRVVSRKQKGSCNRAKARKRLAKLHLKISRQRKDHAVKLARCVIQSNDLVAYEDLRVRNLVKNHSLAKSIHDAGWYQFRLWLEYFGKVTVSVPPAYTSQECSSCGSIVKKSLSTRTHACQCGCVLDRDKNAALNILRKGLRTVGHTGTALQDSENAWGERASTGVESVQPEQAAS